jgi:hypothetical protein
MNDLTPVPRHEVRRLSLTVVGAALFLSSATVHGEMIPGFDGWHQSVSALALGPYGWIQALSFAVFGSLVLVTVPAWRQILAGGTGATWFPILATALGTSFILLSLFPQDPAPGYDPAGLALTEPTTTGLIHLALAGVMAAAFVGAMLVLGARFASNPHWRGWATWSRIMAALTIACIAVYGVWSTRPTGLAGTFERMGAAIPAVWLSTVLYRMWNGAPFILCTNRLRPPRTGSTG